MSKVIKATSHDKDEEAGEMRMVVGFVKLKDKGIGRCTAHK